MWFLGGGWGAHIEQCLITISSLKYTPLLYICRNLRTEVDAFTGTTLRLL
jgi:hypothetical protein